MKLGEEYRQARREAALIEKAYRAYERTTAWGAAQRGEAYDPVRAGVAWDHYMAVRESLGCPPIPRPPGLQ